MAGGPETGSQEKRGEKQKKVTNVSKKEGRKHERKALFSDTH